ncbi:hypothetical protein NOF04DRAFT_1390258 [Fusarium oxysporum II5]|uniref:Uncharacterized protein n=2 Tax=Fusarium oxysporum f. sp. cubense TaxID=61366 RepID=N4UT35_FUSC1|nr:hypothetical protein FOC1_g10001005 [Fusarium oxysporum f. sp. cubense race 1]KAK2122236.1 hypothetical protein NOF04DRAFT_1390258 [Fusarium oxysporum II5]TVY74219.1 hypothetical protein Focb16_v005577 [Fusarium oxysporum f. sp. cubense]TXB98022.1 hypothetical protein FocTR4_00017107 [Fusarium oxysporum f. sp. cubense]
MAESATLNQHADTQEKRAQREQNRKRQADRRNRMARKMETNENTIVILSWGLSQIAQALDKNDFAHIQTILRSLEPSYMASDFGSVRPTLPWSDSFPGTMSPWGVSTSLFNTTDFGLPLSSYTNFPAIGQEQQSFNHMSSDFDVWTPTTNANQVSGSMISLN